MNVKEEPTDDKEGKSEEPQAITTDSGADIKKEPPDVSEVATSIKVEEVVVLSDEESGKENEQVSQGAKLSFRMKNCLKKTCILNFAWPHPGVSVYNGTCTLTFYFNFNQSYVVQKRDKLDNFYFQIMQKPLFNAHVLCIPMYSLRNISIVRNHLILNRKKIKMLMRRMMKKKTWLFWSFVSSP